MSKIKDIKEYEKNRRISFSTVIGAFAIIILLILAMTITNTKVKFLSSSFIGIVFSISTFIIGVILVLKPSDYRRKVGTLISAWLISLVLIPISILTFYKLSDNIRDIPNVIRSEYREVEGQLTDYHVASAGSRSSGTRFKIRGIEFHTTSWRGDFFTIGEKYQVKYLPHSKYVIDLKKVFK